MANKVTSNKDTQNVTGQSLVMERVMKKIPQEVLQNIQTSSRPTPNKYPTSRSAAMRPIATFSGSTVVPTPIKQARFMTETIASKTLSFERKERIIPKMTFQQLQVCPPKVVPKPVNRSSSLRLIPSCVPPFTQPFITLPRSSEIPETSTATISTASSAADMTTRQPNVTYLGMSSFQTSTPKRQINKLKPTPFRRSQRGRTLKSGERRAVINVNKYFEEEFKMNKPALPLHAVRHRTAMALGFHVNTVSKILNEFDKDISISTPGKKRPRASKCVLDQVDDFMKSNIRRVIYNMCSKGKPVTSSSLLKECQKENVGFPGKVSSLKKVILNLGFKWKKVDNRRVLMESSHIAAQRTHFLRSYITNMKNDSPLQVIFMDETWIFQRGTIGKCWQDDSVKSAIRGDMNDGRRFIVVHAGGRNSFVPNSSLIFASGRNTGDYHGDMNAENFEKWLRQMLENLQEKSLIIMDNASYHTVAVNKQPTSSWTKVDIKNWLDNEGITYSPLALKTELVQLAKQHKQPVVYKADKIIQSMGHEVVRLPPYHCHFNAIELIWATTKTYYNKHIGEGGDYSIKKTLAVWEAALESITAEEWGKRVDHVEKIILDTWEKEMGADANDRVQPLIINLNDDSDDSDDDDEGCTDDSEQDETSDDEVLAVPL